MILVFDIGNTETTIGLFNGEILRAHWRLMTDVPRTADELGVLLHGLMRSSDFEPASVDGIAIGSVVPRATGPLVEACERHFNAGSPVIVDARAPLPIRLAVDEPLTVGADRIINTLAASRLFGSDAIVVDLGTATTYDCITRDGTFLGGIIAPGVLSSAETLFSKTSKLPATDLRMPTALIGTRTEDCIRAGVMYGAADAIDGLVRRLKAEWPRPEVPMVIGTGGLATLFGSICRELGVIDPYLTLKGLQLAHAVLTSRQDGAER